MKEKKETDDLVSRDDDSSKRQAENLRQAVLVLSWLSMIIIGGLGIASFVISMQDDSTASFAFALDAMLVCFASVVLIWRYNSGCFAGKGAAALYSVKRERIACIILGALFYLSAFSVISRSLISLIKRTYPSRSGTLWKIFVANGTACAAFAAVEFYLAKRLESLAVATDAVNTSIGAVLAISACVADLVYLEDSSVWYIDPTVGTICAVLLIIYGTWVIVHEVFLLRQQVGDGHEEITEPG